MIDQQLIERYATRQDPSAFREIVDRHGPAVLRMCKRLLHDDHEAEDAFQATFLVFVRRTPTLRDPDLLGHWLLGVARRVANRFRQKGVRQSDREKRWAASQPKAIEQDWPLLEIRRAVREELEQLPEMYRQPLQLCYLEGLTHEEAAQRMSCPVGTVKVRLVRARRLLRDRLDRRGVALGVAFLLFLLHRDAGAAVAGSGDVASEASIDILAEATVEAMSLATSGEMVVLESLFPNAFALSQGFYGAAGIPLRGVTFLVVLVVAGFASGGMVVARQASARNDASRASRISKVLDVNCR